MSVATPARAEPSIDEMPEAAPSSPTPAPPAGAWYGWQTLMIDGASVGLTALLATQSQGSAAGVALAGGYLAGAPIVHLSHHNTAGAGKSLLLRLAVPLGVGLVGLGVGLATEPSGDYGFLWPMILATGGAFAGMLTAAGIDAAYFATEEAHPSPAARTRAVQIIPTIALTPHNAGAGLAAIF
jgi:hypothetical protein